MLLFHGLVAMFLVIGLLIVLWDHERRSRRQAERLIDFWRKKADKWSELAAWRGKMLDRIGQVYAEFAGQDMGKTDATFKADPQADAADGAGPGAAPG